MRMFSYPSPQVINDPSLNALFRNSILAFKNSIRHSETKHRIGNRFDIIEMEWLRENKRKKLWKKEIATEITV